jgi:hypothetical protein
VFLLFCEEWVFPDYQLSGDLYGCPRHPASIPLGAPLPEGSFPQPRRRPAGWRSKGGRQSWRSTRCRWRSWRNSAGPGRRGALSAVRVGLSCSRCGAGGTRRGLDKLLDATTREGGRGRREGAEAAGGGGRRRRSSSVEHQISSSRHRWSSSVEHRTTEAAAPSRGGCRSSLAPRAPPASATVTTTLQHLLLSPVLLPARSTDPPMAPRHVGVPRHPRLRQISRSGRLPSFSRGVSSAPLRAVFLETATGKWIARQWRTPVWVV